MWFFIGDLLRNPLRGLISLIVGVGVVLLLLLYGIPHAGAEALKLLGVVLGVLTLLIAVKVPMRFVIGPMLIAIAIVGIIGVMRGVTTAGMPTWWLLVLLAFPVLGARRWIRAHVYRPTPRSHGAYWASWRELKKGGFM